jgi:hypothetical protein
LAREHRKPHRDAVLATRAVVAAGAAARVSELLPLRPELHRIGRRTLDLGNHRTSMLVERANLAAHEVGFSATE